MTASSRPDALYPPTVRGPARPLPLWRFLPAFVRNPLGALPQGVYTEAFVRAPHRRPLAWVTDPVLVERILLHEHQSFPKPPLEKRVLGPALGDGILTAQGASWRWQRRIAAPLFRHQDLLQLVPTISAAAEVQIAQWRKAPPGRVTPIERDMTDLTYDIVTRTLFAGAATQEGEAIKTASEEFLSVVTWEIAASIARAPEWLWHPGRARLRRNSARMREVVSGIVARCRREGSAASGGAAGLIPRMLAARDPETDAPMTDEQIIDNLLTFLLAGHETTAKALTWALYLLACAPDWQDRVRAEVRAAAGDEPIAEQHLDRLPVTTRVLKEALRLYPPAPVLTRLASDGIDLGSTRLAAGTVLILPVYAIHRHRNLWPDADRFDPDRFLPENEARHLRTQFMPFGFGPRTCIGMSFAMIEATVLLAALVRSARFAWVGRTMPEPVSRITLRPRGGMPLRVEVI